MPIVRAVLHRRSLVQRLTPSDFFCYAFYSICSTEDYRKRYCQLKTGHALMAEYLVDRKPDQ